MNYKFGNKLHFLATLQFGALRDYKSRQKGLQIGADFRDYKSG